MLNEINEIYKNLNSDEKFICVSNFRALVNGTIKSTEVGVQTRSCDEDMTIKMLETVEIKYVEPKPVNFETLSNMRKVTTKFRY